MRSVTVIVAATALAGSGLAMTWRRSLTSSIPLPARSRLAAVGRRSV
ncbi:MAG: hypothetical protein ABIS43_16245 [Opitutus sp.]